MKGKITIPNGSNLHFTKQFWRHMAVFAMNVLKELSTSELTKDYFERIVDFKIHIAFAGSMYQALVKRIHFFNFLRSPLVYHNKFIIIIIIIKVLYSTGIKHGRRSWRFMCMTQCTEPTVWSPVLKIQWWCYTPDKAPPTTIHGMVSLPMTAVNDCRQSVLN